MSSAPETAAPSQQTCHCKGKTWLERQVLPAITPGRAVKLTRGCRCVMGSGQLCGSML